MALRDWFRRQPPGDPEPPEENTFSPRSTAVRDLLARSDALAKEGKVLRSVDLLVHVARQFAQDGFFLKTIAIWKQALKLDDSQLKLWTPVEQQLRARFAARQQAREGFLQRMEQRQGGAAERPSLTDWLDRASKRMTERAQRMQAFTEAFKPFYAALSDEQKAVAGIVLRDMRGDGMRGHGRRWAMERDHRGPDDQRPPR